jgi:hypothetical protein
VSAGGYHVRGSHLKLIAASHLRNSLRSGAGVIFLVLSMLVGLVMATIAVLPTEMAAKQKGGKFAMDNLIQSVGPDVLDFVVGATPEQSRFWLVEKPALISLFLILLIVVLPFLAALSGFNQTSGDISSRGLRYLLLRTERANVFLGRLIGTYLFTLAVISIVILVVGVYVCAKTDFYATGDVILWLLRGWVACAFILAAWIAFSAWMSASIDTPFLVLLINLVGLAVWVIVIAIMKGKADAVGYAAYATPWGFKWWLLHPSIGMFFAGILVMLVFTAGFVVLGLRTFHKRDV